MNIIIIVFYHFVYYHVMLLKLHSVILKCNYRQDCAAHSHVMRLTFLNAGQNRPITVVRGIQRLVVRCSCDRILFVSQIRLLNTLF